MKRLFALDLDGTILSEAHSIEDKLVSVLSDIAASGDKILINTGRTCAYSRHILKNLNFDFYASFTNGVALVSFTDGGDINPEGKRINCSVIPGKNLYLIYEMKLPPGLMPRLLSIFEENRIDPVFQGGVTRNDLTYNMKLRYPTEELMGILSEDPERRILVDSFENYDSSDFVSVFGCTNDDERAFNLTTSINRIKGLYSVAFKHSYLENSYWITVGSESINKGIPVRHMIDRFEIERENVFAFGNDRNDIPMLKVAGHAVAVEGSPRELLDIAEETVPIPEEGGVIRYLNRFL